MTVFFRDVRTHTSLSKEWSMSSSRFFRQQSQASSVKSDIVARYFPQWAAILAKRYPAIQYVDMYCGPGAFEDGKESTPVRVARAAAAAGWGDKLRMVFNDEDGDHVERLKERLAGVPGFDRLAGRTVFDSETVGEKVADQLAGLKLVPTFSFIDPFGYTGLTNKLIQAALKDPGSEVLFFMNTQAVNRAIENDVVARHMAELFDVPDARLLREALDGLRGFGRYDGAMQMMREALCARGHARHVVPFSFLNPQGSRVLQRLVFVTKRAIGAAIMKEVMAYTPGSRSDNGLPLYVHGGPRPQPDLFPTDHVARLAEDLHAKLAGKGWAKVEDVALEHTVDTPFLRSHAKEALLRLEAEGRVECDWPRERRQMRNGLPTLGHARQVRAL